MKTRIIHTKIWEDSFFSALDTKAKLLFVFLITNKNVELTGAYEIPIAHIAVFTGLTSLEIQHAFENISEKIAYVDGYVVIKNSQKYQDYSKGNENQRKAFSREFELLPLNVRRTLTGEQITTSPQLVDNQLTSSPRLDINKKTEIRKKKVENPTSYQLDTRLVEIRDFYNKTFNKKTESVEGYKDNFDYWIQIHTVEKIKRAIVGIKRDAYWNGVMDLQTLFRRKNPRNEAVDYIEQFSLNVPELKEEATEESLANILNKFKK